MELIPLASLAINLISLMIFISLRSHLKNSDNIPKPVFKSKKPTFCILSEIKNKDKLEKKYFIRSMPSYLYFSSLTGCSVEEVQKILFVLERLGKIELVSIQGVQCFSASNKIKNTK